VPLIGEHSRDCCADLTRFKNRDPFRGILRCSP
jgi:hypothetical protein